MEENLGVILQKFGTAGYVLSATNHKWDMLSVNRMLIPAIKHDQIEFAFDEQGIPLAFWTWAYLSTELSQKLTANSAITIDECDWRSGEVAWILNFACNRHFLRNATKYLRFSRFAGNSIVNIRLKTSTTDNRLSSWLCSKTDCYDEIRANSRYYLFPRCTFAKSFDIWKNDQTRERLHF